MLLATPFPTHYDTISWEYVALVSIQVSSNQYGKDVALICEDDEASGYFSVRCESGQLGYLQPYAERLAEAGETPVVPVYRANGYAHFCISGALYDYPELGAIRQRICDRVNLLAALRLPPPPPPPDCL